MGRPTLAGIVGALGGELLAGGRRANVPGPGHSRADRSVSLLLVGGRVVVHCFAGDDWREVLDDLRARGLVDRDGRLTGAEGTGASLDERPTRVARVLVGQDCCPSTRLRRGFLPSAPRFVSSKWVSASGAADGDEFPAVAVAP